MNVAFRRPMTLAEFLAWEDRQELRYEFDGVRPVAMTGGTAAHAAIARNLLFQLTGALRGKPCQPYGGDLKIEVAGRIRYPDAFVVCTPVPNASKVVTDPVVVFEILSPSSSTVDFVDKNGEYRQTSSIKRYVILEQTRATAVVFSRKGLDWVSGMVRQDGALDMPEIGIRLPMSDLYEGLELAPDDAADGSADRS